MTDNVTVVIPARNAQATVGAVLRALLPQTRRLTGAEVLLVDNGSDDRTREIAASLGVRVIVETRTGAAAARNAGWRAAGGELVAFLDSDCIPQNRWLEELVAAIRAQPSLGAVGGRIEAAASTHVLQRYAARAGYYFDQEQALSNPFMPYLLIGCSCYRRTVLDALGGLDETLRSGEDTDLTWRMQLKLRLHPGFAPDAVVEHVHRSTLRGLWEQWSRYGYGAVQLERRYPDRPRPVGRPSHLVIRAVRELGRSARNLLMLPLGRTDVVDVVAPLLRCFEVVANRAGRRRALR